MKSSLLVPFLLMFAALLAGCQTNESGTSTPAVQALEAYLNALVNKDEATLTLLSCADWEANALLELDSFQSVETSLEGLSCKQNRTDNSAVTVTCGGKILTSYGGELQEYDLSQRTYSMVEQGSDWLVCGF